MPDWLSGYDAANAEAAAKSEAIRQELDRQALEKKRISEKEYQRRAAGGYGADKEAQRQEIDQAFEDSVVDSAKSISSGVSDTLSFGVWRILSAVPPVVWGLAAVGLFIYMGGGVWLKGSLNRRK